MKMKVTMLKHADKMQLSDERILPVKLVIKPANAPTLVHTDFGLDPVNMVEVVKCWQGDILLYQRIDFEKETAYCDKCDTIDDAIFRPDHSDHGYYTASGEWECGKCHSNEGLGVLRQCSICGMEFNSHEGECICEVCGEILQPDTDIHGENLRGGK